MTPLDEARLSAHRLVAKAIGCEIEILGCTSSTNDLCHERAQAGADGLVIAAEQQLSGRGQRGRTWEAPAGSSLLFSILLRPPTRLDTASFLVAWAAMGIARTLRNRGLPAQIKWPNDVLVNGRKLCGILVEKREATVVGIGLNVNIQTDEFPTDLRLPATSVAAEIGAPVDRTDLFVEILKELDATYIASRDRGPEKLWEEWPEIAEDLVDCPVSVHSNGSILEGRLVRWRPDEGVVIHDGVSVLAVPAEHVVRVEGRQSESRER